MESFFIFENLPDEVNSSSQTQAVTDEQLPLRGLYLLMTFPSIHYINFSKKLKKARKCKMQNAKCKMQNAKYSDLRFKIQD
jgi:hypothetical protein